MNVTSLFVVLYTDINGTNKSISPVQFNRKSAKK